MLIAGVMAGLAVQTSLYNDQQAALQRKKDFEDTGSFKLIESQSPAYIAEVLAHLLPMGWKLHGEMTMREHKTLREQRMFSVSYDYTTIYSQVLIKS